MRRLVTGRAANICDECVDVCADIVAHRSAEVSTEPPPLGSDAAWAAGGGSVRCALCGMPCLSEEVLLIDGKGVLCRVCVTDVDEQTANDRWVRYSRER